MYCNGVLINPNCSYRIKNNFEGSENCFWYVITSRKDELHSHCISQKNAEVYKGSFVVENIALIREYKNAKLIEV